MLNKFVKSIIVLFAVFGLCLLISWILGYPPTKNDNPLADYEGIVVMIQAASVIVLIFTIIFQITNSRSLAKKQEEYTVELTERQESLSRELAENQRNLIKKQIDISLFEKRYEIYQALMKIAYPLFNASNNSKNQDKFYEILFNKIEVEENDIHQYNSLSNEVDRLLAEGGTTEKIKRNILRMKIDIRKLKAEAYINRLHKIRKSEFLFDKKISKEINSFLDAVSDVTCKILYEYKSDFSYVFDADLDIESIRKASDNAINELTVALHKSLKL